MCLTTHMCTTLCVCINICVYLHANTSPQIHIHSHTLTHYDVMSWLYAQHLCENQKHRAPPPPAPRLPSCSMRQHSQALRTFSRCLLRNPLETMSPCFPGICMFASTAGRWVLTKSTWLNTKGSGSRSGSSLSISWKETLASGSPFPHPETKRTFI